MFILDKGIRLTGSDLWLDAKSRVKSCCVSHAHLDHGRRHERIIASEKTIRFLQRRIGRTRSFPLNFREPFEFDGFTITLFPAGHILGSAQILVERNGLRLLYSGDINMQQSATAEAIEIPESDILIMESTFGRPKYRFRDRGTVEAELIRWVEQALQDGVVPVVVGYVLGKSQEAMKILGSAGFELSVHGSIAVLAKVYEEYGIDFGKWQKCEKDQLDGKVLIIPRTVMKARMITRLPRKRSVFLSGWALHSSTKFRNGVDHAIALSDHADFEGLVAYVEKVNPRKIYTTHGFKDFPIYLRGMGYNAELLKAEKQLSLF